MISDKKANFVLWRLISSVIIFLVAINANAQAINSGWPTTKDLQLIQQTTDSYPLIHQVSKPKREIKIESNPLVFNEEEIKKALIYNQTTFNSSVKVFLTHFKKSVLWVLCLFNDEVLFSNTISDVYINFEWAIFKKKASFIYCSFKEQSNFYQAAFHQPVSFYGSKFYKVNFSDVNFNNDAIFTQSQIGNHGLFRDAQFDGKAMFDKALFMHEMDFSHVIFNGRVDFSRTRFDEIADFSSAVFQDEVIFNQTRMPTYLNFSNIQIIKKTINMNVVNNRYQEPVLINLVGTDIANLILDYTLYQLDFPSETSSADILTTYESLIKIQKNYGFTDGYKKLFIEYKTYQYQINGQHMRYLFDKYMWNFGFETNRLIAVVFYIILLFTLINAFFYRKLHEVLHIPYLNIYSGNSLIEKNAVFRYLFYLPFAFIYTIIIIMRGVLGKNMEGYYDKSSGKNNFFLGIYFLLMSIGGMLCTFIILQYILK